MRKVFWILPAVLFMAIAAPAAIADSLDATTYIMAPPI